MAVDASRVATTWSCRIGELAATIGPGRGRIDAAGGAAAAAIPSTCAGQPPPGVATRDAGSRQHPRPDRERTHDVTSPYSSSLLQQPVDAPPRAPHPAPQPSAHTRSVAHVVAAPPMYAPVQPAPAYVTVPARGGSVVTSLLLALVVLLVGAVAFVGARHATLQAAPSGREAAFTQSLAQRDGFRAGRARGIDLGRDQALQNASMTTALRAATARQRAYDAAYRRGERAGRNSYRAPRYTGYRGGGYRAPRYGGYGNAQVAAALGQAQQLANITGAPVDVEVY